jgi:hypothetical protein
MPSTQMLDNRVEWRYSKPQSLVHFVSDEPGTRRGVTTIPDLVARNKGYILAAVLGAVVGGVSVAVTTRAVPRMMSSVMSEMMRGMMAEMGNGCNPSEM